MVELVLDHPRFEALRLDLDGLARLVQAAGDDATAKRRLLAEGVGVLHLYSLNTAAAVEHLVEDLGLAAP